MKSTFTLLFLSCLLYSSAQSFSSPESVEYDANHQRYIVANTSANNLQQVIPESAPTLFVSNVPSPYGIAIVGDTVYVCCNSTHLRGYNLTTGALAFDVNLGGTFLNGICTDFAGNIFVTDFSIKKIVRYNIATQLFNNFVASINKTPNGIVFDPFNNRLAVATWGTSAPILGVPLTDSATTILKSTSLTNIDGLTIDEDGNFYAADWGSDGIYFFDAAFANTPLKVISGLNNPADISYNILSDTLAVPNTGNNTVTYYGFPRPVPANDYFTATVAVQQTFCVLQNDLISGNVPLVLQSFSSPQLGNAVANGNCIDYTASSIGTDTITYVVCSVDTPAFCKTAILYLLNVNGTGNNAPIAVNDTASTVQPNSITVNVGANDLDGDAGDTLCITSITGSNFFSLDIANCTNILFSPDSSFVGNDTCWYIICDNGSPVLCDTASLIVTVNSCLVPGFQLIYLCGDDALAPIWGCPFCAKFTTQGVYYDSLTWTISGYPDWVDYDTIITNRDTVFVGFQSWCGNIDAQIPYGFDWVVCATTQSFCGSITVCDTIKMWWENISEIPLSSIHLFPNPASNVLTIDMQNNGDEITRNYSSIEILNAVGEKQKVFPKKGTGKTVPLDVSDLPNGMYLATILSGKHERRMLGKFTINW